jgi:flagellar hook-length control protein FliK
VAAALADAQTQPSASWAAVAAATDAATAASALQGAAAPAPLAAGSSPSAPAAPTDAQIAAPPGSASFAPQLGAQITTFARNGIEHARLHLNPADMGPVMVQIQLDGQTAQIHMSADHAATRQALEQAMPTLASGLREAGLTLAGGGVFEQAQQAQDQSQARGDTARGKQPDTSAPRGTDADTQPDTAVQRRRGVVDLVA